MASTQLSPLHHNVPIVDPETGNPTPFFQQMIQQLLNEKGVTDDLADGAIQPGTVTTSGLTAAAQRLLGNKESTSGAIEELTLSQALDLIGSAAQGDLLFRGASGWQRLAAGTSGQFLKTLGAGANPAWATASGGGGGSLVLLEQHTASSSATLDFTACISGTYDEYQLEFVGIVAATNGTHLLMRFSTDGGSTYDASGTAGSTGLYDFAIYQTMQTTFSANVNAGSSQTSGRVAHAVSTSAGCSLSGSLKLFSPASTSIYKQIVGQFVVSQSDGNLYVQNVAGRWKSTSAANAFRFLLSSGNIASGTIRVYGIAKS